MTGMGTGFDMELGCRYEEWWRYNVTIICGCFDAAGERIGFASTEDLLASVGSDLQTPPAGWQGAARRKISLSTVACDHIVMYLYIVPHTLPATREIGEVAPFDVRLKMSYGGTPVADTHYRINQWSGASIEIKLRNDGTPYIE